MEKKGFEYQYFIKDHLGNTRVLLSQTGQVLQQNSYYPFGMLMAGLPATEDYNANKYLYNGKELQEDFGLDWYDYGARFYDSQLGRWFVVDAMAEKYYWLSSYTYAINNPLIIIDIDGNDIDVSNIYQKDKKGNYLYPDKIKAFEVFAKTDVGRQYLIDRAGKDQSIQGVDFNMVFKNEGKLSKKGIDVSFGVKDLSNKADGIGAHGLTETKIDGNRLKINISLDKNDILDTPDKLLKGVETIGHETLFHGNLNEKSFIRDGNLTNTARHKKSDLRKSAYYKGGLNMLQQAQKKIGLNYSRDYLYYNLMLPGFNYASRNDIKK